MVHCIMVVHFTVLEKNMPVMMSLWCIECTDVRLYSTITTAMTLFLFDVNN